MKNYILYESKIGKLYISQKGDFIVGISFNKPKEEFILKETELLKEAVNQLEAYFKGALKKFNLPLKLKGSPFQEKVWEALKSVPYGETRSYKEIAKLIGNEKATRAVGGANNKNPIMIVIPCHRVIGKNGSLVGYASGLKVKEELLKIEKINSCN